MKTILQIIVTIIINVLAIYSIHESHEFIYNTILIKLPPEQKEMGMLFVDFYFTVISLIVMGTYIVKEKEKDAKSKLEFVGEKFNHLIIDIYKIKVNVDRKLQEVVDRKYSVLDLHGSSKGNLVYYIEPKIPYELMNMDVNVSTKSLEVLNIDHFQDVLLNLAYIEYLFKRARATGKKIRVIVTKQEPSFLENYLKLCWKLEYEVWLINKYKYTAIIGKYLEEYMLPEEVVRYLQMVLEGNPVLEYKNKDEIMSIKYKDVKDEICDVSKVGECQIDDISGYIEDVVKKVMQSSYMAKEDDSHDFIMNSLKY